MLKYKSMFCLHTDSLGLPASFTGHWYLLVQSQTQLTIVNIFIDFCLRSCMCDSIQTPQLQ